VGFKPARTSLMLNEYPGADVRPVPDRGEAAHLAKQPDWLGTATLQLSASASGKVAQQSVMHLHFPFLPRHSEDSKERYIIKPTNAVMLGTPPSRMQGKYHQEFDHEKISTRCFDFLLGNLVDGMQRGPAGDKRLPDDAMHVCL
jgi:hypothetical protein